KGRMLSKKLKAVFDAGIQVAAELDMVTANDEGHSIQRTRASRTATYTDEEDGYALGILLTCCSESQQQYVADKETYIEAWCALAEHHEPKTRIDRLATMSEYFNMKWNTKQENLPQFLERYEIVLRKLRASGDAIHDSMVVDRLLDMMPWQMRSVTHQVQALPRTQGNNLATVRVLLEAEYKAALRLGALTNPTNGSNDERALKAETKPGKCNWCKRKGHWEDECRTKAAGKPRWNPKKGHVKKGNKEESGNLALDEKVWAFTATDAEETDDADSAVAFHAIDTRGRVLVDSGASTHMTGDASRLTDIVPCERTIVVANGAKTRATRMGTMRVTTDRGATLVMKNVLVIDSMPSTLLSVTAMMHKDPKFAVTFNAKGCAIQHGTTTIATATLDPKCKIYVLDQAGTTEHCYAGEDGDTKKPSSEISDLWHHRAGHLPTAALHRCNAMGLGVPANLREPKTKCECCVKNKIHKITPPKTHTRTFKPGECWVSDTKGPMRTTSAGGCKLYTVYVDAGSGYKVVRF
ncbi:hypothetical protein DYB32_010845, partial [Aphanomyces invadans]